MVDFLMKLGIIGAGTIVQSHIDAARFVGFDPVAICGNIGSERAANLASKNTGLHFFNTVDELIENRLDALLIAISGIDQMSLLSKVDHLMLPTLIEKPVYNLDNLNSNIVLKNYKQILVGYNRRHYSSVQEFKKVIDSHTNGFIEFRVPELSWTSQINSEDVKNFTLNNVIHMIDLLNYLVPTKDIKIFQSFESKNNFTSIVFTNKKFIGSLNLVYGVPDTYSVKFSTHGICAELSPIELFKKYNGIKIDRISEDRKFKVYQKLSDLNSWKLSKEDVLYKPGFVGLYRELENLVKKTSKPVISADLSDDLNAVSLAKKIIDVK